MLQDWEAETKKIRDNLRNIEGAREEDKVKLAEFDVSYDPEGGDGGQSKD